MRYFLAIAICFCLFISLNSSAKAQIFNAQTAILDNGMEIVFIPNNRAPIVTHMVWIKAGAVDEEPGLSGIAHFLEHLLFKGTETVPPGEFSRIVKSYGASHNAFTSKDYTAYFETIASKHLRDVMALNADRMQNLMPPINEVESERLVVLEERRQRVENNPQSKFQEHLQAAHYLTHPYALPIIGWMEEIEKLSWDDAYAFYKKWYVPNNMILVVSGDVEFEELVKMAQETYGQLKPSLLPKRNNPVLPQFVGQKTLTYEGDDIFQAKMVTLLSVPSFSQSMPESLALQVLQEIISGDSATYLHDKIVIEKKLASQIGFYYADFSRYDSVAYLSAVPNDGVPLKTLDAQIQQALKNLHSRDLSEAMIKDAKKRLVADAIYARDSLTGPAMIIGRSLSTGAKIEDIERWDDLIQNVPAEDVKTALETYLMTPNARVTTGYIYPKKVETTANKGPDDQPRGGQPQDDNAVQGKLTPSEPSSGSAVR